LESSAPPSGGRNARGGLEKLAVASQALLRLRLALSPRLSVAGRRLAARLSSRPYLDVEVPVVALNPGAVTDDLAVPCDGMHLFDVPVSRRPPEALLDARRKVVPHDFLLDREDLSVLGDEDSLVAVLHLQVDLVDRRSLHDVAPVGNDAGAGGFAIGGLADDLGKVDLLDLPRLGLRRRREEERRNDCDANCFRGFQWPSARIPIEIDSGRVLACAPIVPVKGPVLPSS
jgi:hypothetical protein